MCNSIQEAQFAIVIGIVTSSLLKWHSKAKCRAPAYSLTLGRVKWVVQRII